MIIVCTLCMGGTAFAAEPEKDNVEATIDDIIAVTEQLVGFENEIEMLAQLIHAEASGIESKQEQAAVAWCVLNRFDAGYDDTISEVIKARHQFAYRSSSPVLEDLRNLAQDVVTRWLLEKRGIADVGRVLPADYLYFAGRNGHNYFRTAYQSRDYWDWSMPDPYVSETAAGNVEN